MTKPKTKRTRLDALGINIYGGGFTLGVLDRFNVLGQWEECDLGRKTFDLNFDPVKIHRPLKMEDWPIADYAGQVPFVYANPPCAPWSSANTHKGKTVASRFKDKRLALTEHTYETALRLRPQVFITESVENGWNHGWDFYVPWCEKFEEAGYHITVLLTDAVIHGSPSKRRRFHLIFHKVELVGLGPPNLNEFVPTTVRDAIGDLAGGMNDTIQHTMRVTNYDPVIPFTQPGGKLQDAIEANRSWYTGPNSSFLAKRFLWDSPAFTMVNFNFVHPDGERWITIREAMRLCCYPDTFRAHNAIEAVDAVLPLIARMLAKIADDALHANRPIKDPGFTVIDWRPLGRPYAIGTYRPAA